MDTQFFKRSKEIANNFIQSVLFVDDEIFSDKEDKSNSLDGERILKAFSKSKKLCALNNPKSEQDFDDIVELATKADITVLDWRINFEEETPVNKVEEEEDAEENDLRGKFTLKLINKIFSDPLYGVGSLKLILIYTGETDLPKIVDSIKNSLENYGFSKIDNNIVSKENVKIVIAGKPSLELRFAHTPELKEWIVKYDEIPEFLLDQFTQMTSGLISNVALSAITSIRNNSYRMLQIYNKNLDPAFLSHRSMLPIPEDASDLLLESITHSFKAIVDYENVQNNCNILQITNWINDYTFTDKKINIAAGKDIKILPKELIIWQKLGFQDAFSKIWQSQFPNFTVNEKKIFTKYDELHKSPDNYFLPNELTSTDFEESFSILTHHKSNLTQQSYIPKLTLGSLIKGTKSNSYWLCIQQKCDSVRIPKEESRKFLFLPLTIVQKDQKFNIVVKTETGFIRLKINLGTYLLRTIKFKQTKDGMVYGRKFGKGNSFFFTPFYNKSHVKYDKNNDETFIWILDLKDSHAQRVANMYASQVSRIGLDESEWLRRWSGN